MFSSNKTKSAVSTFLGAVAGAGPILLKNRNNNPVLLAVGGLICAVTAADYYFTSEKDEVGTKELSEKFITAVGTGGIAGRIVDNYSDVLAIAVSSEDAPVIEGEIETGNETEEAPVVS